MGWWRRLFPIEIKTETFEDFIAKTQRHRCTSCSVSVTVDLFEGRPTSVAVHGLFIYRAQFSARSPEGEIILFKEVVARRYGSNYERSDRFRRVESLLRCLAKLETRFAELRAAYPNIEINLVDPHGKALDREVMKQALLRGEEVLTLPAY